jgi:type II secretory pathway pseudopilin PulG
MRKSFTLIELIAVMAVMFTVMGISVVILIQAFDFQQTNNEHAEGVRAVNRLLNDFREDVHSFGKPMIPTEGEILIQWKTETAEVCYTRAPSSISPNQQAVVRWLSKDGQSLTETYRLPDRTTVWCVDGETTHAGLVALSLWTTPPGTETPKLETLNPFDRTMPSSTVNPTVNSKYAGNWRTIAARYK